MKFVPAGYQEVEDIRDPDGITIVITERIDTGHLSFRILKEYENHGEVKTTSYLGRRHIPAIRRLLQLLEDRLEIQVDRQKLSRARAIDERV